MTAAKIPESNGIHDSGRNLKENPAVPSQPNNHHSDENHPSGKLKLIPI